MKHLLDESRTRLTSIALVHEQLLRFPSMQAQKARVVERYAPKQLH